MTILQFLKELKRKNKKAFVLLAVVCSLLIISIVVIVLLVVPKNNTQDLTVLGKPQSETVEKNEGSISIPGFEGITLKAESIEQNVALYNPSQNSCYMKIELYLSDGTLLWTSKLTAPGEQTDVIKLNQILDQGNYPNAYLKYSCFKMDKKTPLNGAETKLTLRIK